MLPKCACRSLLIFLVLLVRTCLQAQIITTFAGTGEASFNGDGIPAISAALNSPSDVTGEMGLIYIADTNNNRIRVVNLGLTPESSIINTEAGNGVAGFNGFSGSATSIELNFPEGIALNSIGNLYIADTLNNVIRIEIINEGINTVAGTRIPGYSGDGHLAKDAELNNPTSIAVDSQHNLLYIADTNNNRIRQVDLATGIITTVAGTGIAGFNGDNISAKAAELNNPTSVAVDSQHNLLYIADTNNNRIRQVDLATGIITTVAGTGTAGFSGEGTLAIKAQLNMPQGIALNFTNNLLYIADTDNNRIRQVDLATGIITTVAGTGTAGFNGDGISAKSAELNNPMGIFVDSLGNLYIADTFNNRIRKVSAPVVATLSPNSGHVSGETIVNVAGSGFVEVSQVFFGETPALGFTVNSDQSITAVSPPGLGLASVRVVTSFTTSADTLGSQFFYTLIPLPTISSISPTSGPTTGDTMVTITGNDFINIVQVLFGETPALSFTVNSKNSITAVSPSGTGLVDIRVVSNAEISPVTPADQFTYVLPIPSPPEHLRGRQVRNRFATQTDIVNVLTWQAPSQGETPSAVAYKIYRDAALTKLIKIVKADDRQQFKFKDHNRRKHKTYTYFIVSVDAAGHQSVAASVTVEGH